MTRASKPGLTVPADATAPEQPRAASVNPDEKAKLALSGTVGNTLTMLDYVEAKSVRQDSVAALNAVRQMAADASAGRLADVEAILVGQALSLDAIYGELARTAKAELPHSLERFERLLRLGLRAQSQSQTTLRTLIEAKNPRLMIGRQTNVAHGHQQVNNAGTTSEEATPVARTAIGPAMQNELMDNTHEPRMDAGTTSETGRGNPQMAPVGARHRPA